MTVLNDRSIAEAIERGAPPLATQIDPSDIGRKDSRIQPASLDLSIGEIRLPGSELDRSGSHAHPLHRHALKEGETAVVTTLEELEIPSDMSAIGIPPSSISLAGLLMTNPGHIDPGYKGRLHFTVINMGKQNFELRQCDPICTVVFLKMCGASAVPYQELRPPRASRPGASLNQELLDRLSRDFLGVDDRSRRHAGRAVARAQWFIPVVTSALAALIGAVTTLGVYFLDPIQAVKDRLALVEAKVDAIGSEIDLQSIDGRLGEIEERLDSLD